MNTSTATNNVEYLNQDLLTLKGNFVDSWLSQYESKDTRRVYAQPIKEFFAVSSPSQVNLKMVQNISTTQVQNYINKISTSSKKTINRKLSTLSSLIDYVNDLGDSCDIKVRNPFNSKRTRRIAKTQSSTEEKIIEIFSAEEREQLFNVITVNRDYVLFKLLFNTGIRRSEVINLTPNDIFTENNKLWLRANGKGRKIRLIPLNKEIKELLDTVETNPSQRYFTFSADNIYKMLQKYCAKAGIVKNKISPHIIRHTYASILRSKNISIETIQKLLGHENIKTTIDYIHDIDKALTHTNVIESIGVI